MNIHVNELHGVGICDIIVIFLHLVSDVFFITLCIRLVYSHPLALGVSHYICSQPLDLMGIHLFHCTHGGERMALRDVVRDASTTIAKYAKFHVSQKWTHVFLPPTL
jgi:hypothetical protein